MTLSGSRESYSWQWYISVHRFFLLNCTFYHCLQSATLTAGICVYTSSADITVTFFLSLQSIICCLLIFFVIFFSASVFLFSPSVSHVQAFFPSPLHLISTGIVTFLYTNHLYDHVFQATQLSLFVKNMDTNICLVNGLLVNDFKDFKKDLGYKNDFGEHKKIYILTNVGNQTVLVI